MPSGGRRDPRATPSPAGRQRILRLLALGYTNAEIARELYLSVRTVEMHRAHIQQRLGVSARADLVRYALEHEVLGHHAPLTRY